MFAASADTYLLYGNQTHSEIDQEKGEAFCKCNLYKYQVLNMDEEAGIERRRLHADRGCGIGLNAIQKHIYIHASGTVYSSTEVEARQQWND